MGDGPNRSGYVKGYEPNSILNLLKKKKKKIIKKLDDFMIKMNSTRDKKIIAIDEDINEFISQIKFEINLLFPDEINLNINVKEFVENLGPVEKKKFIDYFINYIEKKTGGKGLNGK